MLATLALFLWVVTVFWILRYRVHFHVTYNCKRNSNRLAMVDSSGSDARMGKSGKSDRVASVAITSGSASHQAELQAALVGLGCSKTKARSIAEKVASQGGDFDAMLRSAIREAA